jgi:cation:H+ antiporter
MIDILWLVLGGVLLFWGGEWLVRGAVGIAALAGLSPLVIGLTVVSAGTSAPELGVSVLGAIGGSSSLAIGNVIGSNICNILLIGGLTALIRPIAVQRSLVRREIPLLVVVTLGTVLMMLWRDSISRAEGAVLVAALIAFIAWSIRTAREEPGTVPELPADVEPGRTSIWRAGLIAIVGLALLVYGADRFVLGAIGVSRTLGLSETVIGLTVVAIGTSLPELVASGIAALKGQSDIALGNVVGSNLFNLMSILGITALIKPLAMPDDIRPDLAVMFIVTVLLLPFAATGTHIKRGEGALLLGGYIAYTAWLLLR